MKPYLFQQDLLVLSLPAALAACAAAGRDGAEEDPEQREEEAAADQARADQLELERSKALVAESDEGDHLQEARYTDDVTTVNGLCSNRTHSSHSD